MYNAILGFEQAVLRALFQGDNTSKSPAISKEVLDSSKTVNGMLNEGEYEIFVFVEDAGIRTLLISYGSIS